MFKFRVAFIFHFVSLLFNDALNIEGDQESVENDLK
jgi:hypothetical protein